MRHLIVFFALLAVTPSLQSAALYLSSGDVLKGRITTQDENAVSIDTAFAGEIAVSRKLIEKIEGNEKKIEAATGVPTIEKSQKAWQAQVDVASNLSRGNTDSDLLNVQARWSRKADQHTYQADASVIREVQDGTRLKDQQLADLGYNYQFTSAWSFALNTKYFSDPVSFVDDRYSIHPGFSYRVWADPVKTLSVQIGTGYVWERAASGDEESELADWRLDLTYSFPGALEFFHSHHLYKHLNESRSLVIQSQTGLRYNLSRDIQLKMQVNYNYDSEPVGSAEKDDSTLLFGAGIKL